MHTAIETCGFVNKDKMTEIAVYTDLFLFDFKEGNHELHKSYTGVDNVLILENLSLLNDLQKDIILRCPIIPGYNDRKESYDEICRLANTHKSIIRIEIEPYHSLGESKYAALGGQCPEIPTQTQDQIDDIIEYMLTKTNTPIMRA